MLNTDSTDRGRGVTVDDLRDQLTAAIRAAVITDTPSATVDDVRIEIRGASRVAEWPMTSTTDISLITPDGEVQHLAGDEVESWAELHRVVTELGADWRDFTDRGLIRLRQLQRSVRRGQERFYQLRAQRDDLVRHLAHEGTSAYRLAKALGVAESTVGRILSRPSE